jgi:hypothetical protein
VTSSGDIEADGTLTSPAADLAESVPTVGASYGYRPGDVLVLAREQPGHVDRSSEPYSRLVAGVYATKPGVLLGSAVGANHAERIPMGVVGIIPTRVSLEGGAIEVGDLLVTSSTPGHAMKAELSNPDRLIGAILGKAMEPFSGSETGLISVLVSVK